MKPDGVRQQIEDVLGRLIQSSLCVHQDYPSVRSGADGTCSIGTKADTSIALRDHKYAFIYEELINSGSYHAKLIDGALLLFQYRFDGNEILRNHSLHYWPSPTLPSQDAVPELYEKDDVYDEISADRNVRFPIRFDYAPDQRRDVVHPSSHLTLGQYTNCRIPVDGPLTPISFTRFIVRNFYFRVYLKYKNVFEKNSVGLFHDTTISANERKITHLINGR